MLKEFKPLSKVRHDNYVKLEDIIETAKIEDIKSYYRKLHGILEGDPYPTCAPWSKQYDYDMSQECICAEDCSELQMAISANIAGLDNKRLAAAFPLLAKIVKPFIE
jgi:hypothetical protein